MLEVIIALVQVPRYFSISVESTPDLAHADQLTVVIQYVMPSWISGKILAIYANNYAPYSPRKANVFFS